MIRLTTPSKNAVWALSGKLVKFKKPKFKSNEFPTIKRIQKYLAFERIEDFKVFDLKKMGSKIPVHFYMIGTGKTPRQLSKVAFNLVRALQEVEVPDSNYFRAEGQRDSGTMMIYLRHLWINLMTSEIRESMDFDEIFREPYPEEIREHVLDLYSNFKIK